MSELVRTMAGRLRQFIRDRRCAKRFPVSLPFNVSLVAPRFVRNGGHPSKSVEGHTLDVSNGGLALVVPAIRIGEQYLAGEDRALRIKLELPDGPIEIEAIAVRYESLEWLDRERGYVIGARIIKMTEADRAQYNAYLESLV